MPDQLIAACRADHLEPRSAGLWAIRRFDLTDALSRAAGKDALLAAAKLAPYQVMTCLTRISNARLHLDPPWETVMEDSPGELRKHLPILIPARGTLLVSGLGLGCVLRGLLAKPEVEHVDVVELDPYVLRLVGPEFEGSPRVALYQGDALTFRWPRGTRWDFAWHDCWCEDGSLQLLHTQLLWRYESMVGQQGAWGYERPVKRAMRRAFPQLLRA